MPLSLGLGRARIKGAGAEGCCGSCCCCVSMLERYALTRASVKSNTLSSFRGVAPSEERSLLEAVREDAEVEDVEDREDVEEWLRASSVEDFLFFRRCARRALLTSWRREIYSKHKIAIVKILKSRLISQVIFYNFAFK